MQCIDPINIRDPSQKTANVRLNVPCGRCGACMANRRSDWSFRIKQEARCHLEAHFITLTYSEPELPTTIHGEITLRKHHFQNFLKRLRKRQAKLSSQKIRYYAVGEYGTETDRPHYHVILFSIEPILLPMLDLIWTHGSTDVIEVNDATIHYITKYHVNRRWDDDNLPDDREPEFTTMSRKPGIGHNYIDNNLDFHVKSNTTHVRNNGYIQRMPRYYNA